MLTIFKFCEYTRATLPQGLARHFRSSAAALWPIKEVSLDKTALQIQIHYDDGSVDKFPWHFLQDNCTCSECFHQPSRSRKKRMTSLDLHKRITSGRITPDGSGVTVQWSDNHSGTFTETWLRDRSFSRANVERRRRGMRDCPLLIRSNHELKKLNFEAVLAHPLKLRECLNELCQVGVVLMEDAPRKVGQLKRLADAIGFLRTTHYGNEFTVRSVPDAVNLAYTSETLTVHTDLPYYASPPGTQALHCIKQFDGSGGESLLVDGFAVAESMRNHEDPHVREMYTSLKTIPVEFYDIGEDYTKFHKVHHSPTFVECPQTGKLERIVYSNQQLSSYLPVELENVNSLYNALKTFTDLCYDPKFLLQFKLKEGDVLFFDNWRFLHGRSAFDPSNGERHLEGCYFDWDEVYSRIRVINDLSLEREGEGTLSRNKEP